MLNFSSLEFLLAEAWSGLRRNRIMAFAAIFTAAVSLAITAGFGISALATYRACQQFPRDFDMAVFVKMDVPSLKLKDIDSKIRDIPHVSKTQFISKEEGWKQFRKTLGSTISTSDVVYNPVPNTFRVKIDDASVSGWVQKEIVKIDGVDEVDWRKDEVRLLGKVSNVISVAGVLTMAVLFAGSAFIIANTIRLGIYARRREIAIMRMVGAKASMIRMPFLMEGMLISGLGAALAILLLRVASHYIGNATESVQILTKYFDSGVNPWQIYGGLLGIGLLLGALSSSISLHKYLRESSPEKGQR